MTDFKEVARPLAMIFLVIGIIGLAVAEACGYHPIEWFRVFALTIVGEWFVERGITKQIGKN
jgi:hypothetical protein